MLKKYIKTQNTHPKPPVDSISIWQKPNSSHQNANKPSNTGQICINPNIARKIQVYHDLEEQTHDQQIITLDILPINQGRRANSPSKKMLKMAKIGLLESLHGQSIRDIYQDRKEKRNNALSIYIRASVHIPYDVIQSGKWVISPTHALPRYQNIEFGKYKNLYTRGRIMDYSPLQVLKVLYHQHSIHRVDYRASCKVFNCNQAVGQVVKIINMLSDSQPILPSSPITLSLSFRKLKNSVKSKINSYLSSKIKSISNQNSMAAIKSKSSARLFRKFKHHGLSYSIPIKKNTFVHPGKIQKQFLEKFEKSNSLMPDIRKKKPN